MRRVRRRASHGRLWATLEITLAPFSLLLYRLIRFPVQRLVQRDSRRHSAQATRWQPLDGPAVHKPLNMLALMTSAPRWNTHALIALAGPLQVRHTVTIEVATASASADSWTVVVHAEPAHRIVASLGSPDASGYPSRSISLPPGSYRLALRYYHWSEPVTLPAVAVDGEPAVPAAPLRADTNDFYQDLGKGRHTFYLCLHSYVCTLLRYRRWFPASFVAREYLPAGNPRTTFSYGYLAAGTSLDIDLRGLLPTHDAYFTAYNRASLPVVSYPLTENKHITAPSAVTGSYLIRLHAKATPRPAGEPAAIKVRLRRGARTAS